MLENKDVILGKIDRIGVEMEGMVKPREEALVAWGKGGGRRKTRCRLIEVKWHTRQV